MVRQFRFATKVEAQCFATEPCRLCVPTACNCALKTLFLRSQLSGSEAPDYKIVPIFSPCNVSIRVNHGPMEVWRGKDFYFRYRISFLWTKESCLQ